MTDWLFGITEANRWITVSYVIGSFLFTAIFIAILAYYKKKRELVIGFIAGLLMLATELTLLATGYRVVDSPIPTILVLMAIGFNPMFYVASICYSSIVWLYKKKKEVYYKLIVSYFVIGYVVFSLLAMFVVPALGEITIRRLMFNGIYVFEALIAIAFFAINYWLLNLKRLTKIAFAIGVLVNLIIEGVMILAGIRWYTGSAWIKFPIHVLFELNAGIMFAIFLVSKLKSLKPTKKTKKIKYF